jgi:predicted metal-dependent phosphoesterase TrpH
MKVELHCHTMRYSGCAVNTPFELMSELIRRGYGAVYITEHDAVWTDDELDYLRCEFPQIRIFPGVEISLGACHVLVLGTNARAYLGFHDPSVLLDMARDEGHLTILAHPFRWEDSDLILKDGLAPDALEYRTNNHDARWGEKSIQAGKKLNVSLVNAGDTHSIEMLDRYWIETELDLENADDIRAIVLERAYKNCDAGSATRD